MIPGERGHSSRWKVKGSSKNVSSRGSERKRDCGQRSRQNERLILCEGRFSRADQSARQARATQLLTDAVKKIGAVPDFADPLQIRLHRLHGVRSDTRSRIQSFHALTTADENSRDAVTSARPFSYRVPNHGPAAKDNGR